MNNYDFLNLSSYEFENLSRDLLQKKMDINLESFTSGRDGGIDIRHSVNNKNNIIVQCKRYSDFSKLLTSLGKEVANVEKLNPIRYIITTSVGLTPQQKDKIQALFKKYILNTSDIYGRDDLNNLIMQFPMIEKQHFKLWLSSVNILERILNNAVINQSNFEDKNIKNTINLYVYNESYEKALSIIKDKRYVIISGIPGIGKTTLARILTYYYLANGYEEFIFLSDSINEGYANLKEGVKQIFFFDDFLGRNFLEKKLNNNEEQRIIRFIESVNNSKDKILILTTREYILAQAKQRHDIFDNENLDFAKCVIDLSQYTKMVRAKILYNHLYFSSLPEKYIENLLYKENYNLILEHKNYNPRIINIIISQDNWKKINASDFTSMFIGYLDYPESIWRHAYENQISKLSQCILANLMSTGTPIFVNDLKNLIQSFANNYSNKYGITYSEIDFRKSIQELENTFIISQRDQANQLVIDYQNPSVQDFLVNYFKDLPDFLSDIIRSALFFNQLFSVFTTKSKHISKDARSSKINKIILSEDNIIVLLDKLMQDHSLLNSSTLQSNYTSDLLSHKWTKKQISQYYKIDMIAKEIKLKDYPTHNNYFIDLFKKILFPQHLELEDYSHYINLIKNFRNEFSFDVLEVIILCFDSIDYFGQLYEFLDLEDYFPYEYDYFTKNSTDLESKVYDLMYEEACDADDDLLESTLDDIESISSIFNVDCYDARRVIEHKIENKKASEENYDDDNYENYYEEKSRFLPDKEYLLIKDMFNSLKD